jgi:hypothetical protein
VPNGDQAWSLVGIQKWSLGTGRAVDPTDRSCSPVEHQGAAQPISPTTPGIFSCAEASSTGSSTSRILHAVDLTDIDHDLPVAAHQLVVGREASSGPQNGPKVVQIRGEAQGGADPTDHFFSPVEHQGAGRVVRRLHGATFVGESLEAINVTSADGVQFLEDRTSSWEDRLQHEAVSPATARERVCTSPPHQGVLTIAPAQAVGERPTAQSGDQDFLWPQ